jgi:hypothetical protein
MAATKITYDEIPKHLGKFGTVLRHRGFIVMTRDDLPSLEVTRIEIRQAGRFFHYAMDNASLATLIPVAGALGALSLAAADGIAFLIPPKVYEIVH